MTATALSWASLQGFAVIQNPERISSDTELFWEDFDRVPQAADETNLRLGQEALLAAWQSYLDLKYQAAALVLRNSQDLESALKESRSCPAKFPQDGAAAELIELLERRIEADQIIYAQRIRDLPVATVRETWCPHALGAFREWAEIVEDRYEHLDQSPGRPSEFDGFDKSTIVTDAEFVSLADDLSHSLDHDASLADVAYLNCGLLAEEFRCRFVDFLEPADQGLEVVASTIAGQDLFRLADRGHYERGEGITGSSLLIEPGQVRRWILTQDLAFDLRKSIRHQTAYEAFMGPIHDYIVVPAFDDENELIGAFRLVDRIANGSSVPWPLEDAFRAVDSVAKFAKHYPFIRDRQMDRGDAKVQPPDPFTFAFSDAAHELRKYIAFAPHRPLMELLGHLTSVASRRVERRSLGCTIGICDEQAKPFVGGLSSYRATRERELTDFGGAADEYDRVDPTGAAFVWTVDREYLGVKRLDFRGNKGTQALAAMTAANRESLAFLHLDRDSDCIQIFARGENVADFLIKSDTGRWAFRDYDGLRTKLSEAAGALLQREELGQLLEFVRALSYSRRGAMIVIANSLEGMPKSGPRRVELDEHFMSLEESEFMDLASIDGAVFLKTDPLTVRAAGIIFATHSEESPFSRPLGARHHAASSASKALGEANIDDVVIVISENRPITILSGGDLVIETF